MQCFSNETLHDVFIRFCIRAQINQMDVRFYYESIEINRYEKTLEQLGLNNFSTICVISNNLIGGNN